MKLASLLADPAFETLKQYILDRTALHYYAEKDEDLAARIARRMTARDVRTCAAYLQLLQADLGRHSEWDALIGEITIGETYFFRQQEHFDLLRTVIIPDVLRRNAASRTMRIWSAGCATGAEPYSISLLLHREFADQLHGWDVKVLATDINVQFLAQARTGRFGEWTLRHLPDSIRECCFRRVGPMWELLPDYRSYVQFEYQNLASDDVCPVTGTSAMDVIMCRNVLIYFSAERIRQMAARFYEALAPGGWLLVGHAEPSSVNFPQFEVVSAEHTTAYRKPGSPAPSALPQPNFDAWPFVPEPPSPVSKPRPHRRPTTRAAVPPAAPPPVSESRIEAARAYADQGSWEDAGRVCRAVLDQHPLNAAAHFLLGLVLEHDGKASDAEASFRRAIYLDRGFVLAHYHLGLLLHNAGSRMQARRSFRNTMELLGSIDRDEPVPHGDGILAGELRELAQMHLEAD